MNPIERAIEMLQVANRYIDNHSPDGTIIYDEAECDGYCVADDCKISAQELELGHTHEEQRQIIEELGKQLASARQNIRDVQQRNEEYRSALEWYAAPLMPNGFLDDGGKLAQNTLEKLWCEACGKFGDHRSGTCPFISHGKPCERSEKT